MTATDRPGGHIRGSSLLLLGRGLGIVLNFAVQIAIVRYLVKSDYGAFAFAFAFMKLGSQFSVLGLDKSLDRFVPIYQERRAYEKMAGTILLVFGMIVCCGAGLVALLYGLQGLVGQRLAPDSLALSLLLIFVCMVPVQALDNQTVRLFAIFASPRAVFLRRHVLTPGLKLAAVLALIAFQGDAVFLALAYLTAGVVGVAISLAVLAGIWRRQGLLKHFRPGGFRVPAGRVLRFGLPLLSSDLVYALRGNLVVLLLGLLQGSLGVAAFRAVLPVARLNVAVFDSFRLLFVPMAARMYARGDREGINELYWRSASWVVVFTFPIFALSFAFSEPLTLLLFGERYVGSSMVLTLLAFGIFVSAAFGFNVVTLRVFDQVRAIVRIDLTVVAVAIALNVVLIRAYGALGGALASCAVLLLQNALYQWALVRVRAIQPLEPRFLGVLGTVFAAAGCLFVIQQLFSPSVWVALAAAGLASLIVVWITGPRLQVESAFPELRRFAAARRLLGMPEPEPGEIAGRP